MKKLAYISYLKKILKPQMTANFQMKIFEVKRTKTDGKERCHLLLPVMSVTESKGSSTCQARLRVEITVAYLF